MVAFESLGPVPEELSGALGGSSREEVSVGCSGARVLRAMRPQLPPMYVKIATGALREELAGERDRLHWLHGRLPVPEVLATADDGVGSVLMNCYQIMTNGHKQTLRSV
jgi:aminoglycoside phosphotransferase